VTSSSTDTGTAAAGAAKAVLITLAAAQFVMILDASVMNVSIATVASDLGTTVTGIQTAITLYTLVMAAFMITGGRMGAILGRKRAFAIGCVVYACGSLTTAAAPNLGVLILGWSLLEGLGATLVMPAVVALVASNFAKADRPKAFGVVAAGGAIAVGVGPLVGGLFTTYWSWRYVFVCEALVIGVVLLLNRRTADTPRDEQARLDMVGTGLSALGLGLVVYGVLRSGTWGFVLAKPDAPQWLGLSPVIWLVLGGGAVLLGFLAWEKHRRDTGRPALLDPAMLRVKLLRTGLGAFFFQYLLQAGLFFAVPLYLSIALGLNAIETGVRILPLSITLVIAAVAIPKLRPHASPRRVARIGFGALFLGLVVFVAALDAGAGPEIVTWPMILAGFGIGALASQLGAVTVSSQPDELSSEVGGLQNTFSNLGISIGTALAGAVLMSALTASFFAGIADNPDVPDSVVAQAETSLTGGVPFVSDADLESALSEAGVSGSTATAIADENAAARLDGLRAALSVLALLALAALVLSGSLPTTPVAEAESPEAEESASGGRPGPHEGSATPVAEVSDSR
jgi:MFS family permease